MSVDFSKLGTKTKMFRGDDSISMHFPHNNVNQIAPFFKKFFIEGFDPTAVTSCVALGGVVTITTGVEFKASRYKVVALSGSSESSLNNEFRVMEAHNKTTFKLYAPNVPDGTYTGALSVKFAPLGWELVAESSTAIAIRSKVAPYNRYTLIADWSYKSVATASFVSAFMGVSEDFVSFAQPYKNLLEVVGSSKRSQVQWCFSTATANSNTTASVDSYGVNHVRWELMRMTYWLCGDDKMFYGAWNSLGSNRITSAPDTLAVFGAFKPYNYNERHPVIFQGFRWSSDTNNSSIDGNQESTSWYSATGTYVNTPTLCSATRPTVVDTANSYSLGQSNAAGFNGGTCFMRYYGGAGLAPAPCSVAVLGTTGNNVVSGGSTDWETTYYRSPNVHLGGIPLLEPQLADIHGLRGVPYGLKFIPCHLGDVVETSGFSSVTKVVELENSNIVDTEDAEAYVIGLVNTYSSNGYGAVAFPLQDWV